MNHGSNSTATISETLAEGGLRTEEAAFPMTGMTCAVWFGGTGKTGVALAALGIVSTDGDRA